MSLSTSRVLVDISRYIRTMKPAVVFLLDIACTIILAGVLWITVTGGGTYEVAGHQIRAHSAGNAILLLTLILISRLLGARRLPFLGVPDWCPDNFGNRVLSMLGSMERSVRSLDTRAALTLVCLFTLCALIIRLSVAWFYPGFFSGDDVEILEFVFSRIDGRKYQFWDLRNPFYPTIFVLPAVKFAQIIGVRDPNHLVFAGRTAVTLWSLIAIGAAYGIGRTIFRSQGAGLVTAFLVAFSGLSTRFSASVLPRAVAGSLLLTSVYFLLEGQSTRREILAGFALGVAASLRFSETAAVLAAVVVLILERRGGAALRVAFVGVFTMAVALGIADWWFRGDPFHSSMAIFQYTVLERGSSRGTQPWYEYLPLMVESASLMAVALASTTWGWKARRPLIAWFLVPVFLLSLLPHKEIRYLVPYNPILMVLAGVGLLRLARCVINSRTQTRWRTAVILAIAVPGMLLHQADLMRFRRSAGAVACARRVASSIDCGVVAFEQSWQAGGSIFLPPKVRMLDIDTLSISDPSETLALARRPDVLYIGLRGDHARIYGYASLLAKLDFAAVDATGSNSGDYVLFERVSPKANKKPQRQSLARATM